MKRIYHTWDQWECYPAGMYETRPPHEAMSEDECRDAYAEFLADDTRFEAALNRVITEWPNSCEHYLSNERMNRIAWLGQAAACIDMAIPRAYRGGFNRLDDDQRETANQIALVALNKWLTARGEPELDMEAAQSKTQMDLY